jgi:phosphatidate cytidylyltransferase
MDAALIPRVAFAAAAIPVVLLVVWWGGTPLVALLAAASALGALELFGLAERQGVHGARALGAAGAAAVAPIGYAVLASRQFGRAAEEWWPYLAALWLLAVFAWALASRSPAERPTAAVAVTALAVAYAGVLPAFVLAIRHGQFAERSWAGASLVFFPLAVTWVCDTAAMFAGRALGGPKLAPVVSPGKTRSGSLAGVAGGLLVAPLFAAVVFPAAGLSVPLWQLLAIAGALSVAGQVGDLAESLLKREAGVKDSSSLLPGHGGVLDRLDSLYFVVPLTALMYRAFGLI